MQLKAEAALGCRSMQKVLRGAEETQAETKTTLAARGGSAAPQQCQPLGNAPRENPRASR